MLLYKKHITKTMYIIIINNCMTDIENCDDITKFFYIMYDSLLTNKNQNKFASNLCCLLKTFCFGDFKNILNIKILTLNLKQDYRFAYKLCLLLYIKCDLFHKLANIYQLDLKSNETKILELIVKKLGSIHDDILYINAFDLYSYKHDINDNIDDISTGIDTQSTWEFETRNEIIRSLVLLVEHFTIEVLEKMNVKIIMYSDTLNMSFKELSKYYNKQVVKIDKALKNRKQYCDSFIEVEKSFVTALITFDDEIYFDDFDIVIKSKDGIETYENENDDGYEFVGKKLDELEKALDDITTNKFT